MWTCNYTAVPMRAYILAVITYVEARKFVLAVLLQFSTEFLMDMTAFKIGYCNQKQYNELNINLKRYFEREQDIIGVRFGTLPVRKTLKRK